MFNAISVDLEDWYHVCGFNSASVNDQEWHKYSLRLTHNLDRILNLFEKYNIKATFFAVGIIAKQSPELIKRIADHGHELATHGYLHRRIFDMTQEEFEQDLITSVKAIELAADKKVLGYRAPEWSLKKKTSWVLDILKKNGLVYDASAVPLTHLSSKAFGLYPNKIKTAYGEIIEFPLSAMRCFWESLPFSGGLPLRIVPYFHIVDLTRELNKRGVPVMFYLHPWEFDVEHVRIDLPLNRKFMHYCNLKSAPIKFELLFKEFKFTMVKNVLGIKESPKDNGLNLSQSLLWELKSQYLKSVIRCFFFIGSITALLILVSFLMGHYAFILVFIVLTVWYWPFGRIIEFFLGKK